MPNLPESFVIDGMRYKIEVVKELLNEDGEELDGETKEEACLVRIRKQPLFCRMVETLIHEIDHLAVSHTGMGFDTKKKEEEDFIWPHSLCLYSALSSSGLLKKKFCV